MKLFDKRSKKTIDITYKQIKDAMEKLHSNRLEVLYEQDEHHEFKKGTIYVDDIELVLIKRENEYCFEAYAISITEEGIKREKRINRIIGDENDIIYWVYNQPNYEYKIKYYIQNIDDFVHQYKKEKIHQTLERERKNNGWKR